MSDGDADAAMMATHTQLTVDITHKRIFYQWCWFSK